LRKGGEGEGGGKKEGEKSSFRITVYAGKERRKAAARDYFFNTEREKKKKGRGESWSSCFDNVRGKLVGKRKKKKKKEMKGIFISYC